MCGRVVKSGNSFKWINIYIKITTIACTNTIMCLVYFWFYHSCWNSRIFGLMYVVFIKIIFVFLSDLLGTMSTVRILNVELMVWCVFIELICMRVWKCKPQKHWLVFLKEQVVLSWSKFYLCKLNKLFLFELSNLILLFQLHMSVDEHVSLFISGFTSIHGYINMHAI